MEMKMYDILLDNDIWVTVIAQNIRNALALAEANGDTAIDCRFIKNIENLIIEREIFDCGKE